MKEKTLVPSRSSRSSERGGGDITDVYARMCAELRRFAYRYLKTPHDVEDVVQEAFVRVLEAQRSHTVKHIPSYVYQTIKNLSLNELAKCGNRLTDTVGDQMPKSVLLETATIEEDFEARQKFELFCRAVRQLPTKCQRAYILRKVYGFSHQEIAQRMGVSVKTVEAHLTKAIVRCTDFMNFEETAHAVASTQKRSKCG